MAEKTKYRWFRDPTDPQNQPTLWAFAVSQNQWQRVDPDSWTVQDDSNRGYIVIAFRDTRNKYQVARTEGGGIPVYVGQMPEEPSTEPKGPQAAWPIELDQNTGRFFQTNPETGQRTYIDVAKGYHMELLPSELGTATWQLVQDDPDDPPLAAPEFQQSGDGQLWVRTTTKGAWTKYTPLGEPAKGGYLTEAEATAAAKARGQGETVYPLPDGSWALSQGPPEKGYRSYAEALAAVPPGGNYIPVQVGPNEWQLQYREPKPQQSLDLMIAAALDGGSWDKAQSLWDFKNQPTSRERLEAALQYATAPGDYMTLIGMARGELPTQAQPGTFEQVAPPADFLQQTARDFFARPEPAGFGPARQPADMAWAQGYTPPPWTQGGPFAPPPEQRGGIPIPGVPTGAQVHAATQTYWDPNAWDAENNKQGKWVPYGTPPANVASGQPVGPGGTDFATIKPADSFSNIPPTPPQIRYKMRHPVTGEVADITRDEMAGFVEAGFEQEEELPGYDPMPPLTNEQRQAWIQQYGYEPELYWAQAGPTSFRYRLSQLRLPQGANLRNPSFLPSSVKAIGLRGEAVGPVQRQFPAMGALTFPSAQSWRNLLPMERSMFQRAVELQRVPWEDYSEQWRATLPSWNKLQPFRRVPTAFGPVG